MLLKICLGALLIIICVKIGKIKANTVKNEYLFFYDFRSFIKEYEQNLSFSKKDVKSLITLNYTSNELNELLKSYLNGSELVLPNFLNSKEIADITAFFNNLGVSDTKTELLSVKNYYQIFNDYVLLKNEKYKKYYSVYLKIGFSVGIMLLIMVI